MSQLMRLCAVAGVLTVAAGGLVSCDGSSSAAGSGKNKPTIAFVVGNTSDAFYQKANEGAQAEASRLGIKLLDQGPTQFDPATQIAVVNTVFARQPNALAIAPVDPTALIAPLQKWASAKTPIVTFDGNLQNPPFKLVSEISSQNLDGGKVAADEMARLLNSKGKVAIIDLSTADKVLVDRKNGFIAELKAKDPGVSVVSTQLTGSNFASAQTITQTLLTKYPDLKGIFCTFELASLPSATALAAANAANRVTLVGFEAGPKTISYIKQGVIKASVAQQPAEEGRLAVLAAYDAATGKTSDVKPAVQLPDVLITRGNVDTMKKYYYQVGR